MLGLTGDKAPSELNRSQINPAIERLLANERESFQQDAATAGIVFPALAGDIVCRLRQRLGGHFDNGEVWYIGPLFLEVQFGRVQLLVEFTHVRGGGIDTDEYRRGHWHEGFHASQSDFERVFFSADSLQDLQCGAFRTHERARRKNGQMSGEVREVRMQFPPKVLDELPCRAFQVSHERVTRVLHTEQDYTAQPGRPSGVRPRTTWLGNVSVWKFGFRPRGACRAGAVRRASRAIKQERTST